MEKYQFNTSKSITRVEPLFPNYFFAQFDLAHHYPLVKWGKSVNHILGFGKYPTPIANEVISTIHCRTDENNIVNGLA